MIDLSAARDGVSSGAVDGTDQAGLTAAGEILLVSCYEPGYQPLALASVAAFLIKAGYAPSCLDLAVEDLDEVGIPRLARARMVAISVPMHTAMVLGIRVAERVRALDPSIHICFFGLYAHLNETLLRRQQGVDDGDGVGVGVVPPPLADSVFGPECEELLVELAGALRDGRDPVATDAGRPRRSPTPMTTDGSAAAPTSARLRRLPFLPPARQSLPPLHRYARLLVGDERRVTGYVEATRGCLYLCRHCPIPPFYEGRFFAVPADLVLDDIGAQVAAGARHIVFGDPDFLNSAKHALAIVRRMHAAHPTVTFSFTAKVEHIVAHEHIFPELARLGCVFMVSAVESLSERVLRILDKGHTRKDVYAALGIVRGAGVSLRPTFVAFTPWTTLEDYLELCELIASQGLEHEVDPVQLAIRLLIPPGSLLLDQPELRPFLTPGPLDERSLTHAWTHPDPRMDRLYQTVAELVEEAARIGEDPAVTFARVHQEAASLDGGRDAPRVTGWAGRASDVGAGDAASGSRAVPAPRPPPRLSEPWFCCAQPTRTQLGQQPSSRPAEGPEATRKAGPRPSGEG